MTTRNNFIPLSWSRSFLPNLARRSHTVLLHTTSPSSALTPFSTVFIYIVVFSPHPNLHFRTPPPPPLSLLLLTSFLLCLPVREDKAQRLATTLNPLPSLDASLNTIRCCLLYSPLPYYPSSSASLFPLDSIVTARLIIALPYPLLTKPKQGSPSHSPGSNLMAKMTEIYSERKHLPPAGSLHGPLPTLYTQCVFNGPHQTCSGVIPVPTHSLGVRRSGPSCRCVVEVCSGEVVALCVLVHRGTGSPFSHQYGNLHSQC